MSGDFEKELAVSPSVSELTLRRLAQRNAAKDEWPGVEREFLSTGITLLPNQADGPQLFEPEFSDAD